MARTVCLSRFWLVLVRRLVVGMQEVTNKTVGVFCTIRGCTV